MGIIWPTFGWLVLSSDFDVAVIYGFSIAIWLIVIVVSKDE